MNESPITQVSLFGTCTRPACTGKVEHPGSFHRYDAEVINQSQRKEIEQKCERFFEDIYDDVEVPFPLDSDGEFTDDDDYALEFRDWFTAQVIAQHFTS